MLIFSCQNVEFRGGTLLKGPEKFAQSARYFSGFGYAVFNVLMPIHVEIWDLKHATIAALGASALQVRSVVA